MKKLLFLLSICSLILFSCDNDDENNTNADLLGVWNLTALSIDPGDGSGIFEPTVSNKTIEFKNDGAVVSNGEICDIFGEVTGGSTGTYSEEDLMIASNLCNVRFEMNGNELIIFNLCDEPCKAKFSK
jgi:hypothetical protein